MLLIGKVSIIIRWKFDQSGFKLNVEKDDNYNNYIIYDPYEGKKVNIKRILHQT